MRRVLASAFILGLIVSAFACEAEAGFLVLPVTVKTGGDPWYIYDAPIILTPNSKLTPATGPNFLNPIDAVHDDYLTLYNIKGFQNVIGIFADAAQHDPLSDLAAVARVSGTGYTPPGQTPPPPVADAADLSLYVVPHYPPIVNAGTTDLLLGYLVFQSTLPPGDPPTLTIEYRWQDKTIGGQTQTGQGSVPATIVPEPSAVVSLGLGLVALGGMSLVRRRKG